MFILNILISYYMFAFLNYGLKPTIVSYSIEKSQAFVNANECENPLEAAFLDLNSDGRKDFIVGKINHCDPRIPSGFIFLEQSLDGQFYNNTKNYIVGLKAFHPRNFTQADFNGDGIKDLFIADHGIDLPPFPGAQGQILIGSKTPPFFINETNVRLPLKRDFTFNAPVADVNGDGFSDILLSNHLGHGRYPILLINDGKGFFHENSDIFPHTNRDYKNCFMYSAFIDLDNDGVDELVAGADSYRGGKDAIFKKNSAGKFEEVVGAIPNYLAKDWSTVSFSFEDLNGDGRKDIIAVNHNKGFTKGNVNLFFNKGNLHFEKASYVFDINYEDSNKFWIPQVLIEDVNDDSRPDIIFFLKSNPEAHLYPLRNIFHLFLNNGGGRFENITSQLTELNSNYMTMGIAKNPKTGHKEIILLSYNGEISRVSLNFIAPQNH